MKAKTYSRIFEPVRIGKVWLRNRIIFPAMDTTYSDENGYVTDRVKGYYEARARGGAGMVTVEAATIDMKVARSMACMLSLDDDKFVPGLKELVRVIKKHGAVPAIQVFHGGRQDDSNITKTQPVAPSPVRSTSGMMAVGAGMLITFALAYMKLQFQWWPLHPVAFPLAPASTIQSMTFAIFGTWLFKSLLLRYGGPRAHLRALPFFLGLLAGAATESTLHRLIAEILGVRV